MIAINTVQKCQLSDNDYSKSWLLKKIEEMSAEDVSLFCKEIAHLTEFYDSSCGAQVTDIPSYSINNPNHFWTLEPIDFTSPITFKKI